VSSALAFVVKGGWAPDAALAPVAGATRRECVPDL
jgi:hypothetical protein